MRENLERWGFGLKGGENRLKAVDCRNKDEDFHPKPLLRNKKFQSQKLNSFVCERDREMEDL